MTRRSPLADERLAKRRHYLMLLALLAREAHGLAIAREVERLSGGRVRLWPATLYGSLVQLRRWGLIEELPEPPPGESERRRFYRITTAGREAAGAETRRLAELVRVARARTKPREKTA
jgi:DNA-binding PadR family transcriptional regulator